MSGLLERLADAGITVQTRPLGPAVRVEVPAPHWGQAARIAADSGWRYAGSWADETNAGLALFTVVERDGRYMALRAQADENGLPSQTPFFPAANRLERHARDLFGLRFDGHPDPRRWTRHRAWAEDVYPLRLQGIHAGNKRSTPPDNDYPFQKVEGPGVYEIPVGPVHAGIIEPGHFRFQAVGEDVYALEERLGYVHKGIEKIAVGRDAASLARLAGRVSGDTCVAHAWAACLAMERAAGVVVPPRALSLRAVLAERERIVNHLGDVGAICNDVAFTFAHMQLSRLAEQLKRSNYALFGHRLLMDRILPGGVCVDLPLASDIDALHAEHAALKAALKPLIDILFDHPSLEDRLIGTGRLAPDTARRLAAVGYVGKASGQEFDVRRAAPYPPYDALLVRVPVFTQGDVAARMRVRLEEIDASLYLLNSLLSDLPAGDVQTPFTAVPDTEGLGMIEGWRGEILTYVRFDERGQIARFFPRDPSWFTWPALEHLIHGNIVPDFPVCNKSVNASYSGHDL